MPYFVRAFCKVDAPPAINTVLNSLRAGGLELTAGIDDPTDRDSSEWEAVELTYKAGNQPIVVECNRDEGDDSLVRAECDEFIEAVDELDDTSAKRRVVDHLRATRFIVSCQLLSDCDDDGYEANARFLTYFVERCGGLIQADGEGFYDPDDAENMLVEMD